MTARPLRHPPPSRYRNRVEFKAKKLIIPAVSARVDIETEWNLKLTARCRRRLRRRVDIETEWNLKGISLTCAGFQRCVDIETEWNLKQ